VKGRKATSKALAEFRQYNRMSDKAWLRTILDSVDGRARVPMPSFPSSDIQTAFVGRSNKRTMREAWTFYLLMAEMRKKHGLQLGPGTNVLDFGCGWGRFTRMFLRDVPADNIWCADVLEQALAICRETGVPGHMVKLDDLPPSPLPTAHFDMAFAYSVFSHLSPHAHGAWEQEFARIMRPGALVFATVQGRWFLDKCQYYRDHPDQRSIRWHDDLARLYVDHDEALARYDNGDFLYESVSGDGLSPEFYGDAVVPLKYLERQWGGAFEVLDFIQDRQRFDQAVAVMRRPLSG
jgi:SAM-dependent methyltransferase